MLALALADRPRRPSARAWLGALLLAAAACGPSAEGPAEPGPAPAGAKGLSWERVGVFPVGDDGRTASFEVTLPAGARSVSLRASAPSQAGGGACFALEGQKAPASHGYGLWVLPSEHQPLGPGESLPVRVALRDCRFDDPASWADHPDMPASVTVEKLVSPGLTDTAHAVLPARIAWMTADDAGRAGDEATVAEALAAARARLGEAGVDLRVDAVRSLPPPPGDLEYGPGSMGALDAAEARAMAALLGAEGRGDAAFLPLILVPCLVRVSPDGLERLPVLGQTVRVPGGAPVGGAASGVFLSTRACGGREGGAVDRYGTSLHMGDVIAHETGHFLGLVHDDERPAASANEGPTLMSAEVALYPAGTLSLSPLQADFARRHPFVVGVATGDGVAPMPNRSGAHGQGVVIHQEASSACPADPPSR